MRQIQQIDDLRGYEGGVHVALGVFDGLHLGHVAVIEAAKRRAREGGGVAGMVSFDPYPQEFFGGERAPRRLFARPGDQMRAAEGLGLEFLLTLAFDGRRAGQEPEAFLAELAGAGVRTLAVGDDWRFGRGRRGDGVLLRAMEECLGYAAEVVPAVEWEGERISSTRIRQAMVAGRVEAVEAMLGREWTTRGVVIEGRRLGRQLGFPTANVRPGPEIYPPDGVWVVEGEWDGQRRGGVAHLGVRPTVDGNERMLEIHWLDYDGDLYGREMAWRWVKWLRGEQKFGSLDELKEAICHDVVNAGEMLRAKS